MTTRFTAEIVSAGRGGHAVVVPRAVAAAFPGRQPRVMAVVAGQSCPTRLMTFHTKTYMGLRQEFLRRIGAVAGDAVEIELTEDAVDPAPGDAAPGDAAPGEPGHPAQGDPGPDQTTAVRTLLTDRPDDLAAYRSLPAAHQLAYARWVTGGATEAVCAERLDRMVRRLRDR